jgi:DeoR/GlpR family transcriptional regulator of sugar metabolism
MITNVAQTMIDVIEFVNEHDRVAVTDVLDGLPHHPEQTIRRYLSRAASRGDIARESWGVYAPRDYQPSRAGENRG